MGVQLRSILLIIFSFLLSGESYAQKGIYGCWNNIGQVPVDPKYSPTHESTTAEGYIICFKQNRAITTVSVGEFEALGTEGKFSYRDNHLLVIKKDLADGWPFAFKIDHCDAKATAQQLTISECRGWDKSKAIILHRQMGSPDMNGVAAGLFK